MTDGRNESKAIDKPEPMLIQAATMNSLVLANLLASIGDTVEMMAVIAEEGGNMSVHNSLESAASDFLSLGAKSRSSTANLDEAAALVGRLRDAAHGR